MKAYPKIGAKLWALLKVGAHTQVVPATVIGADWSTGKVVFRWSTPGLDVEFKRGPGGFWASEDDAQEALWKLRANRWKRDIAEQQSFFTQDDTGAWRQ